jgi:hypothetical protein
VSQKPILRVTYKRDDTTYSVLSVWPGKFPGTYSVSRDKGNDKYPAISIIDVLKAWAAGTGFVNVSVESEREQRSGGERKPSGTPQGDWDDSGGAPF